MKTMYDLLEFYKHTVGALWVLLRDNISNYEKLLPENDVEKLRLAMERLEVFEHLLKSGQDLFAEISKTLSQVEVTKHYNAGQGISYMPGTNEVIGGSHGSIKAREGDDEGFSGRSEDPEKTPGRDGEGDR